MHVLRATSATDLLNHMFHPLRSSSPRPEHFTYPFCYTPHPLAREAAEEVMVWVREYMRAHTTSELLRLGKMFGVLVVESPQDQADPPTIGYLCAFSAMLDGTFYHDGFVPPVFDWSTPNGYFRQEEAAISRLNEQIRNQSEQSSQLHSERKQRSQALQRWMFAQFHIRNAKGETSNLLQIFAGEPPIISQEDYFSGQSHSSSRQAETPLPPSGAGECCAPKLLQYAYLHHFKPLCLAEFWMGASPKDELRREGQFYPACTAKCKPILRHMLQGIDVEPNPLLKQGTALAQKVQIMYEDDDLLVADKPAGLLSVPGKEGAFSLQEYLQEIYGAPLYPVHRLDMDTSGLIVFGKNEQTGKQLQQQFLRRDVHKVYKAVLEPFLDYEHHNKEGIISLPLLPNPYDRPRQMVSLQHGKTAVTHWRLDGLWQKNGDKGLLITLVPETGRTHQLRVHCAHPDGLNCPIKGDNLYGQSSERLMLHAAELTFIHPRTGRDLHLSSPAPWL